jgi:hypothetical protein
MASTRRRRRVAYHDYALGQIVETVAAGPFAESTLIVSLEDDTWDSADHADALRSSVFFAGAYVRNSFTRPRTIVARLADVYRVCEPNRLHEVGSVVNSKQRIHRGSQARTRASRRSRRVAAVRRRTLTCRRNPPVFDRMLIQKICAKLARFAEESRIAFSEARCELVVGRKIVHKLFTTRTAAGV